MATRKKQEVLVMANNHPFRLLAVSSLLNVNKLVWSMNSSCGLRLVKNQELEAILSASVFSDRDSLRPIIVSLIPNKQEGSLFLKQLPNVDFVVELNGPIADADFKKFVTSLKKIEGVMAAIEVNPAVIKRKDPFCPE
ncbi:MAG: IPExxxVDY family protein [Bacteroidales bacterium]